MTVIIDCGGGASNKFSLVMASIEMSRAGRNPPQGQDAEASYFGGSGLRSNLSTPCDSRDFITCESG